MFFLHSMKNIAFFKSDLAILKYFYLDAPKIFTLVYSVISSPTCFFVHFYI